MKKRNRIDSGNRICREQTPDDFFQIELNNKYFLAHRYNTTFYLKLSVTMEKKEKKMYRKKNSSFGVELFFLLFREIFI